MLNVKFSEGKRSGCPGVPRYMACRVGKTEIRDGLALGVAIATILDSDLLFDKQTRQVLNRGSSMFSPTKVEHRKYLPSLMSQ